jgi:hypothetical protein
MTKRLATSGEDAEASGSFSSMLEVISAIFIFCEAAE